MYFRSNLAFAAFCVSVSLPTLWAQSAQNFIAMTPCRLVDTRLANGPFGGPIMAAGQTRSFTVPSGSCGIPSTATAYSLNLTIVVPGNYLGYLTIWPTGQTQPLVSTLNDDSEAPVVTSAAIVAAGTGGAISIYVTDPTHVILDVNGYFLTAAGSTGPQGPTGPAGPQGPAGPAGFSGSSAYGDGSAGALMISTNTDWTTTPPSSANFQFTTVTVDAARIIPSGLTIRSTGDFGVSNGASITVAQSPYSNQDSGQGSNPGVALRLADPVLGGSVGLSPLQASQILRPGMFGGSSGYEASNTGHCPPSGQGGGTLVLRIGGGLNVAGAIDAPGADGSSCSYSGYWPVLSYGSGGGGGGFIVIAAQSAVNITGSVNLSGGKGGNGSDDFTDPGIPQYGSNGSGGGGILSIIAPSTPSVAGFKSPGGMAGTGAATLTQTGSYPGGACGGNGGGQVTAAYGVNAPTNGSPGYVIFTQVPSPSSLFQ
jgi:hypothetical protein